MPVTTSTVNTATSTATRATPAQIRKAATNPDLQVLIDALQGWTAAELHDCSTSCSKHAVHMAAWQGPLANLQYLLEVMHCNVNTISTGDYSYGKTPLFFACTASRNDIVEYLLTRDAKVTICNNKGQSVLSIAASHLKDELISKIQELEQGNNWWNFRESHSDGLEYGDLDPRFLDRPLRESDVVTPLAINPTTKQSRKGSFFRRNPTLQHGYDKKQGRKTRERKVPVLTSDEENEKAAAWARIIENDAASDLMTIVRLHDKLYQPWIPQVGTRLAEECQGNVDALIQGAMELPSTTKRERNLLSKIQSQVQDPEAYRQLSFQATTRKEEEVEVDPLWIRACDILPSNLSMKCLEIPDSNNLSLPTSTTFVDTINGIQNVKDTMIRNNHQLIAFDTEWYDDDSATNQLATLQLAVVDSDETFTSWVIDLIGNNDSDYLKEATALIQFLFEDDNDFLTIGFAVRHNDIPKLQSYITMSESFFIQCLDLQFMAASIMDRHGQHPGLQCSVGRYSGTAALCKQEQCSDWARRPLTQSQLTYAALDAVVLLVLLAELRREEES